MINIIILLYTQWNLEICKKTDYNKNYLDLLEQLTEVDNTRPNNV